MSGSLTPLPDGSAQDLPDVPASRMPGFHHRKEVQRMLRRWRNAMSLGRLWVERPRDPWEASQRYTLPQHTINIK